MTKQPLHPLWKSRERDETSLKSQQQRNKNHVRKMTSDAIYQSSKPSSMLSFHCCSESSHRLSFPARLLLHPHSLFVLQYGKKKTYKIFIIQLVCDKLMWGWNILLTYLNYPCSKATDNRLEASEQSIRTIILFKILSCTYTHILQPIDQVNSDNGRWFHQQTSLNRKRQKSWMLTYLQPWEETNQTYQVNQQPANWVL